MALGKSRGSAGMKPDSLLKKKSTNLSREKKTLPPISVSVSLSSETLFGKSRNLHDIFKSLAEILKKQIKFDRVSIAIPDEKLENFRIYMLDTMEKTRLSMGTLLPIQETSMEKVLETGNILICDEIKEPQGQRKHWKYSVDKTLYEEGIRSYASIPLLIQGKTIGILNIGSKLSNSFSMEVISEFRPYLDQLALALENLQLKEDRMNLTDRVKILTEISQSIVEGGHQKQVIEKVVSTIQHAFGSDFCIFADWDPVDEAFVAVYQEGLSPQQEDFLVSLRLHRDDMPLINLILNSEKPIAIDDLTKTDLIPVDLIGIFNSKSSLSIPLRMGREMIGNVMIVYSRATHHFTESEIQLASEIMSHITIAFENARLFQQQQMQFRVSQALLRASQSLTKTLSLKEALEQIVKVTQSLLGCDYCIVLHWDPGIKRFQSTYNEGISDSLKPMKDILRFIQNDQKLAQELLSKSLPIMLEDPLQREFIPDSWIHLSQVKSILLIPLISKDKLLGVVQLGYTRTSHVCNAEETFLAGGIAHYASIALENTRLFQQERERTREMEIVTEIGRIISSITSPDKLFPEIYAQIRQIIPCDVFYVATYNPRIQKVQMEYLIDEGVTYDSMLINVEKTDLIYQIFMDGKPMLVNRENTNVRIAAETKHTPDTTPIGNKSRISASMIFVPMKIEDEVTGVLSVQTYTPGIYQHHHMELLTTVSSQAAIALENARNLHNQKQHVKRLELIANVSTAINETFSLEERLQKIAELVKEALEVDLCVIREVKKNELILLACTGTDSVQLLPSIPADEGIAAKILESKAPVSIYDIKTDPVVQNIPPSHKQGYPFQSYLGAPMILNGEVRGIIGIYTKTSPRAFTKTDADHLQIIADFAAVAIENVLLYKQSWQRTESLLLLQEAMARELGVLKLQELYAAIVKVAAFLVSADLAALPLLDEEQKSLTYMDAWGEKSDILRGKTFPMDKSGLCGWVTMNKQAVVVPDLNSDSRVNNELANELDVTTAIVVPLVRESQIIGGISLYRKGTPYTHFDLQTVTLFANQAALSLHNANLFAQRERREKQILELLEVTRHVRSSLSLQDVLNRILEGVIRLISPKPYSSISVMLVDEKTNALTVKAAYGLSQETIRNTREPVGEGIAGWVAKTGDSLLVEDISEHPIFSKNFVARKDRDVITSAISVPLRVQDKIIGVMNVASKEKFDKNRFDEEDVKMMETMADHVAMAIEKSKLYEDLENHYLDTVRALARAVDAKDSYTMDHSQKTSEYAVALAKAMGLNPEDIVDIETASVLHDVGKIGIPDSILMKPGKLTPEEYEEMKKHPELGAKILEPLKQLTGVRELVLYHQERYDGKGYPKGLKGEEIPIGCRIIAVVDAFQAMTSDRIYRKALLKEQAIAELQKYAGTQFDSKVVEAFLFIIQKKPS